MKETTEGGFGYCSTSTLNFLLDKVWNTEKNFLILYLLLSTGQWHRSTKAVVLHVLCSEKKMLGEKLDEIFLSVVSQRWILAEGSPGFIAGGVLAGNSALGAAAPKCLRVLIRQSSPGFAQEQP